MKNILTWLVILVVTANVYAGESSSSSAVNPSNIDSVLKKVELIPVLINGDKDNRINIVIMNRWSSRDKEPYNSGAMRQEFLKDIEESFIAAITPGDSRAQTVFANYRQFFNVYGLWWPDMPEWGKGVDQKTVDALRDRFFLPWKDEYTGWVTFLVMPNSTSGGGGAGRDLEKRFGSALIAGNGIGKMLHEISHTCMSIGDEYTTAATGTSAMPIFNSTLEYRRDKIKWRKWIETDTPLPTPYIEAYRNKIGAFEGCQYHLTNYFRASAQGCIMGAGIFDNTEKMCPICEQRVAMRVNKLVNPIKSFTPSETTLGIKGSKEYHFSIDHIRPEPNTQVVKWVLNGKTIANGVDEVTIRFGEIAKYELICTLTDETPFIRPDPPYGKYPRMEVKWTISNSAPSSAASDLKVELQSSDEQVIKSKVSGGKPPYTFSWSTGSSQADLKNVGPGIYDLVVTDSEYRYAVAHQAVYADRVIPGKIPPSSGNISSSTGILSLEADVTASEKDRANGNISLSVKGGSEPYIFLWDDGMNDYSADRIYEAENGSFTTRGTVIKTCSDAGNNAFVNFNGGEGTATWQVEVAKEGIYPIGIVYGSILKEKSQMNISVNGAAEKRVVFRGTLPMFTGWDKITVMAWLKEGFNRIILSSSGQSLPNLDYLSIPGSFKTTSIHEKERINLTPGNYTITVKDRNNKAITKTFAVPELYPFRIAKLELVKSGPKKVQIVYPVPGYTYKWYAEDAPLWEMEQYEKALATGNEFTPSAPGNYFVAAKNNLTNGESSNRISLAIGKTPAKAVKAVLPSALDEEDILLWFDAGDLDGDGESDGVVPERGPHEWKEKTWRNPGKMLVKFEPNKLNGYGIGAFDQVWVGNIGKEVINYQTIIMVYKENSLSLAGTSPFKTLGKYIGKSSDTRKRLFDPDKMDTKTKDGKTYLNGKQVDPFNTPNPMRFCVLTVELGSSAKEPITSTDGNWEGSLAEVLVINRKLSDFERQGIEEYLRRKWFSSIDIDF
jgi:hypothetical protein